MGVIIQITNNHDIDYTQAGFVKTKGTPALLQDLATRLRLLKGEYLYNEAEGVDYPSLMSSNNIDYILQSIDIELKKDPRVEYNDITYNYHRGELCINVEVKTSEPII